MRARVFKALGVMSLVYLVGMGAAFMFQRRLMYFPPWTYRAPQEVLAVGAPAFEEIDVQTDDGTLRGWWHAPESDKPVVMFFHGNGSAVYSNHDIYADLAAEGYGVLGVGYPGYPGGEGRPTEAGLVAAAVAHHDFLVAQGVNPDRIVFYGTSMGAGVAAQLARDRPPELLIMEAPFTSALEMGQRQVRIFPVEVLMHDHYRSDLALQEVQVPLLWVHGTADRIIPMRYGQALFDGYDGPKQHHIIPDGRHTGLWDQGVRQIVLDALATLDQ